LASNGKPFRRISASVSDFILTPVLTLGSWIACFWLGLQIGNVRSELRRKADVDELERRYKIVDCKAVETPDVDGAEVHP
jgi:hypothetical protein